METGSAAIFRSELGIVTALRPFWDYLLDLVQQYSTLETFEKLGLTFMQSRRREQGCVDWNSLLSRIRDLRTEAEEEDAIMEAGPDNIETVSVVSNGGQRDIGSDDHDDDRPVEYVAENIVRTKRQRIIDSK